MKLATLTKALAAAAVMGLTVAPPSAGAAIINSLLVPGANTIEDTDAERIFDSTGTLKTSGNFAVGDTIESILRFNDLNSVAISDAGGVFASPYKLTAYSLIEIAAITDTGGGACDFTTETCVITFTAPAVDGVMATVYENNVAFNQFGDAPATGIANVQAGTKVTDIGFGTGDDYWIAITLPTGGADIIDFIGTLAPSSAQVPTFQFGQSFLNDVGGLPFVPLSVLGAFGDLHDVVGDGSGYARATGTNTGWLLSTNTLATWNVPEPGSLALLGAAFAGAGWFGARARRRTK